MANLVLINGNKAEKTPLKQAIYLWLLNLFHVHDWKDTERQNRVSAGTNAGFIQIQMCTKCGERRAQVFGFKGRER